MVNAAKTCLEVGNDIILRNKLQFDSLLVLKLGFKIMEFYDDAPFTNEDIDEQITSMNIFFRNSTMLTLLKRYEMVCFNREHKSFLLKMFCREITNRYWRTHMN